MDKLCSKGGGSIKTIEIIEPPKPPQPQPQAQPPPQKPKEAPKAPEKPKEPEKPKQPEKPKEPEKPKQPEKPKEPEKPKQPAAAPAPTSSIKLYSTEFFLACSVGGIASCGLTHMLMTPLDLVKCNMQANPKEFTGSFQGINKIMKARGVGGLLTGWGPTLAGYSVQGAFKFGLYEYFKYKYAHMVDEETAYKYRDLLYLSASASAEFFADVGLAPFEAVKVRIQTTLDPVTLKPTFANGLFSGLGKMMQSDGIGGLYKGVPPLWMRQIPYTMMKFFGFERAVELIYSNLSKPKDQYNKLQQLGVSFAGGYLAGIFCAAVSHPADTIVSKLNKNKSMTIGQVWRETSKFDLMTKGLGTRIVMIGTLTGLQWLIYDSFKTAVGLPTTGGAKKAPAPLPTPTKAAVAAPVVAKPAAAAPAAAAKPAAAAPKKEEKKDEKKH